MKAETLQKGLKILEKYGKIELDFEHDQLFLSARKQGSNYLDSVSDEDKESLEELNFFTYEDMDCFTHF